MSDANDILMGSGSPTAKFPTVGAIVTGTVVREPTAQQQNDFRTKVPLTWKDGSPKMMVVVQLQTADRDPERADDDGVRSLYIKGKNLTDAIRNAVRTSGAKGIHTGGTLSVQYIADGPPEPGLEDGPKIYVAQYTPPTVSFQGVTGPAAPAVQQQIPVAQPAQQVYQQPAAPAVNPAAAALGIPQQPAAAPAGPPPGIDPQQWARLSPDQQQRVIAAMGAPAAAPGVTPPF